MRDEDLDSLLRDSAPDTRPDDGHRRVLRMQLDHNFRHHRPWLRLGMPPATVAAFLAGLALLAGWSIPIGSDVRDLVDGGSLGVGEMRILHNQFRGGGISARDSSTAARHEAEDLSDDLMVGAYTIVGVTGYTVGGSTFFDYQVESTGLAAGREVNVDIPAYAAAKTAIMMTLKTARQEVMARLLAEDWESVTTSVVTIGNRRFRVDSKTMTIGGIGEVQLHEGRLLD